MSFLSYDLFTCDNRKQLRGCLANFGKPSRVNLCLSQFTWEALELHIGDRSLQETKSHVKK